VDLCLANPLDRPLRILGSEALTPCCSSLGNVPPSILAHSTGRIPAILKIGRESKSLSLDFVIKTDAPEHPTYRFNVHALLLGEIDIIPDARSSRVVHTNEPFEAIIRIVTRHSGTNGLRWPDRIGGGERTIVTTNPPVHSKRTAGGIMEQAGEVVVRASAIPQAGDFCAFLKLGWVSGEERTFAERFHVRPWIKAAPSALVIDSLEPTRHRVVLTCPDRAVRVLGIDSPVVECATVFPTPSAHSVSIDLRVLAHQSQLGSLYELHIRTDHPMHPVVKVNLIFPPSHAGTHS
jgi:hypothetical protein